MPLLRLNDYNRPKILLLGLYLLSIFIAIYQMIVYVPDAGFGEWAMYILLACYVYGVLGFLASDFITVIQAKVKTRIDTPWEVDDIQDRDTAILLGSQGYRNVSLPNNYIHFIKLQKQVRDLEIKMNILFDQMFTELHKLHPKTE